MTTCMDEALYFPKLCCDDSLLSPKVMFNALDVTIGGQINSIIPFLRFAGIPTASLCG